MKILKFQPILKPTIWGGDKIATFKGLPTLDGIGESWELSGVEGSESICADDSRLSLNQLVALHGERLVGRKVYERYGNVFPLLIKFIDARRDLSIQVHPDDETAHRQGKPSGKTEMWYLMESDADAFLYCGLSRQLTPGDYPQVVADHSICSYLARYTVREDDVFYLPSGRIHAIGAGCFLAEIQQTSDVTYRIYDYHRKDKDGNYRQLHTAEAAEAIHYEVLADYRTHFTPAQNKGVALVQCPYFTTTVYDITRPTSIPSARRDSFVILIGLRGSGTVTTDDDTTCLQAGQTILIAAENSRIRVSGYLKFLEVHIEL